ncbi:sulfotransferase family protein [Mycobacterium intracellulare]|uniref:sulfotransferase family protein n=1 Tax=Mycobacterium intracellulare TaxID=1767 RepID=UPI0007E92B97|nr:sulfotransferase [Mycobacterium intracellulare]ASW87748.1 sulfotransferase [Mycobacterium intracellulare]MEE3801542.1 sulfotransferase [Mycobacterium intracellulare]OBG13809.1 hypothetical protein A5769_20830 [Mycobacterium intracellulare]UQB87052.1 sulfotransferase [Mycobacterium intracellulare]WVL05451.1 sulfotransferase [Mycobacterium intracellulare]
MTAHKDASVPVDRVLNVERLMHAAVSETGLDDFGPERFRGALETYLRTVCTELNLGANGVAAEQAYAHRILVNRLRFHRDLREHPEIASEVVSDPIIIVGLPRTGTTKLQRVMSLDPSVQPLMLWQALNPAPVPATKNDGRDPRIDLAAEMMGALDAESPDFKAIHTLKPEEPDEDVWLHDFAFEALGTATRVGSFTLAKELGKGDHQRHVYEYEKSLLQYLQWQNGTNGPWILKSPVHIGNLATMTEVFDGATIVHCHRDPRVAIASTLSGLDGLRQMLTGCPAEDLKAFGEGWLQFWAAETAKNLNQRHTLAERIRIVDVAYEDIRRDTIGVIEQVYRACGRSLTPNAARLMERWEQQNPQNKFGSHEYSLDRYGLTDGQVETAFADYSIQFGSMIGAR